MLRNAIAPDLLEVLETGSPGETDFYTQYARHSGGPVLVLMCGTGRVPIAIARQSIPVIGLDSDSGAIDLAKRKAQAANAARAMFVRGEATHFVSESKHPLIIIPGGGLQLLLTLEEQRACLTAVRHSLQVGGRILLDVPMLEPHSGADEFPLVHRYGPMGERAAVIRRHRRYEPARQLLEEQITCDWLTAEGQVERAQYATRYLRFATVGELLLLLEVCGFQAVCYGSFDREPFMPGAERLVIEAERNR